MKLKINDIVIGDRNPIVLFAGPCVVESREMVMRTAEQVRKSAAAFKTPVVFKSSYKKANRTSGKSFMGIGIDEALRILGDVKREFGSASILRDGRVVFNIAGNKYRLVVWINYPYRVVYVRFIGTHAQYDRIDAQTI